MLVLTLTIIAIAMLWLSAQVTGGKEGKNAGLAEWLGSRSALALVFAATFAVLWYSWAALNPLPVVHDEMAYVLQAQIFAQGKWSLPSPPIPEFWQQPHVLVEPALTAKYFPGHSLAMAFGALVGWPALMPLVLQAANASLLVVLARRVSSSAVALLAWLVWLFSPMVLYFGASFFSEATTTFCWLSGWYALSRWRAERRLEWLTGVAVCAGFCMITRPLTGVAYTIPIAVVVLLDVYRLRLWRHLMIAFGAGIMVLMLLPVWSFFATGDWSTTPLVLYTRMYMPYDVPGFGLSTTPPAHALTPEMVQLNNVYSLEHINHFPSMLFPIFVERARYLATSIWGSSGGVFGAFAVLGLVTMRRDARFSVLSGLVLLLTYLFFATPAQWTLYYYESVPAYAYLTAAGMAWCASLIGTPRGVPVLNRFAWSSPHWTRALVTTGLALVLLGLVSLQVIHGQHIGDRKFLTRFDRMLAAIPDRRAIVFVRYAATHNPHVTFVRNTAHLGDERVWVVYDRGDAENVRLRARAPGRIAYLFDEIAGRISQYDPSALHTGN